MDTINIGAYGFLESIAGLAIEVKMICVKFAVMFAVLTAIYGVVKFFFGFEEGGKINFNKYVWTPLITIFLLANYAYLIDVTDSIGSLIIRSMPTAGDKSVYKELLKSNEKRSEIEMAKAWTDAKNSLTDEDRNAFEKVGGFLGNTLKAGVSNPFASLSVLRVVAKLFQAGFISFCRLIIENARGVILGFLVITGPLAILFSINPLHRDMLKKWYKAYVGVLMWAVTINILDALVILYAQNSVGVNIQDILLNDGSIENLAAMESAEAIVSDFGGQAGFINFILGVMYLSVPLLTSLWIGDRMLMGFMNNIMTKTFDYAVAGMKMAAGAATGGKSMIASKGGGGKGDTSGME